MEDLDLDELDQAVTQLMDQPKAKKPAQKPVSVVPKEPVAKVAESPKPVVDKTPSEPESASIPVTKTTPMRPLAKPAPRKRMRPGAMDIIQRPSVAKAPSRRPGREASAVQPTKPIAPEPVQPQSVASVAPTPTTHQTNEVSEDLLASLNLLEDSNKTVKPKPEAASQSPAPAEVWPDPLDVHGFNEPEPHDPLTAPEPATDAEPPTLEQPATPAPEPAASPFVTTKVEKRPLGAYADAPVEPEQPVSAEPPVPNPETSKAEMAEASLQSNQHLAEHESDAADLRHMAIPQQYHTAQAKPSDAVHHVFDTKEYHAPPQPMHVARKSNSGLAIIIVVLIVLVIGVAAVGYLMMTGMLDISKIW